MMADDESTADHATIYIEDETLRRGFTQIPNALLQRKDLSPGAKLTYMALLSFAWQEDHCYPGQERLADAIGMSKRSIDRFIKELEEAHLVSHKQRGLNQTNYYTLHRFDLSGIAKMTRPELPTSARQNAPTSQGNKTQVKRHPADRKEKTQEDYERSAAGVGMYANLEDTDG